MEEYTKGTSFTTIYDSFLARVTSDMYMELTELDTFELLINKKEFIDFLQQKHSLNKIQRTNKAISSILSNL